MNNFAKNLFVFTLLSACASIAIADEVASYIEPVQLETPRYADNGVHYGLPGWETNMNYANSSGVLPQEGSFLHVSLKNPLYSNQKINYGGEVYDEVSITSSGRVYLGHLSDGFNISEKAKGRNPYIEFTQKKIFPLSGTSSIDVRWKSFDSQKNYAVIEIGPFNVEGLNRPVSFQIFFYTDGEIQLQPWVDWEYDVGAYTFHGQHRSSPLGTLYNKCNDSAVNPVLYNGGHVVNIDCRSLFSTKNESILTKGSLRPGWIAKSFDKKNAVFSQGEDYVDVFLGTENAAGGLFAFDNSREHPIVGSFTYMTLNVQSLSYGDNLDASNAVPVFFWYFGTANGDIIQDAAHTANYPYYRDGAKFIQKEDIYSFEWIMTNARSFYKSTLIEDSYKFSVTKTSDKREYSVIWPISYMKSWQALGKSGLELDETLAIAVKFQTLDKAKNRAIRIRDIDFGLRQPRSVQFLPPKKHTLSFETDGLGYMKGVNFSGITPYEFVDGASLSAKIYPAPGDTIEEVDINGVPFYKLDGSIPANANVVPLGDGSLEVNLPDFQADAHVFAKSKKCVSRVLPAVNPSYVKGEVYLDPYDTTRKLETYSVKDGLGRVVQTQTNLGNGNFSVSATYLDDFGNVEYAPMAYLSSKLNFNYEDMACMKCIVKSSKHYDGSDDLDHQFAFGIPYPKKDYHYGEENGVTTEVAGVAEASFAMWKTPAKQWTIPVASGDVSAFLPESQLEDEFLASKFVENKNVIVNENVDVESWTEYNYKLVINRSAENKFTQQLLDANGNVLYAWMKSGNSIVISQTNYNQDNQVESVKISIDGGAFGLATSYTYDEAGRIKTVNSPDKGLVENVYDSEDNLRFTRDARQLALAQSKGVGVDYFSVIEYNEKGKVKRTGEVRGGHSFSAPDSPVADNKLYILTEIFYGKPSLSELLSTGVTTDNVMLQNILDEMKGVLPNDVGAVASYDGSKVRSDVSLKANSLKMSSYNRLGQTVCKWTIYSFDGAPATKISYSYNISGELSSSETAEWKNGSWNPVSTLAYSYDYFGRLKSVLEGGDSLMRIDRTDMGTVSKMAYFDKGTHVYDMTYAKDIYGRTTQVEYKDASGKILYSENATYPSVVAVRLATAEHFWDGYSSTESYSYDGENRLAGYASDNAKIGNGSYTYDGLGRLLSKQECDTTIRYIYGNDAFRPLAMNVNGGIDTAYYVYDASGNVWIDKNSKNTYTINSLGLPSRVRLFSESPSSVTFAEVNGLNILDGEIGRTDMAYDEDGQRIWTEFIVGAPYYRSEVTYPGFGEYTYSGRVGSSALELTRIDLVGGGYRRGISGEALFPVKDIQGSVRGYANKSGLKSAFGFRPYGTTVNFANYVSDDDKRWQSKDFDSEHDKYYFGTRFYDPFFGMWISPDPAGQFANPYSYGGDPLNYIDPTGMWALGLGLVVSWDKSRGWGFGVGVAAEIGETGLNASYGFNQDGSRSLSVGVNVSVPVFNTGLWINGGESFSLNSYTGASFNRSGGVCYGLSKDVACAGVEVGEGYSWDRNGSFSGMTLYAEAYVSFAGGEGRISSGYEMGLFGAEGRGLYAGANVAGLHAQVAQNGGLNYGMSEFINIATYDANNHPSGYTKETLEKAYEKQIECGEKCEIMFKKDGSISVTERNGEGDHFETDFFGENDDDAHTHPAASDNPQAALDRPSNVDAHVVSDRVLTKHYVLLAKTKELVRYRGPEVIQNETEYKAKPADAVIVEKWKINQNAGWKWDFKFRWTK